MEKMKPSTTVKCPIELALEKFGGKWKSRIICILANKKVLRFKELRMEMGNITDAVLTVNLKELMNDEIVLRKQYSEIPPRVEYELTNTGKTIVPIIQSICNWSENTKHPDDSWIKKCETCNHTSQ